MRKNELLGNSHILFCFKINFKIKEVLILLIILVGIQFFSVIFFFILFKTVFIVYFKENINEDLRILV